MSDNYKMAIHWIRMRLQQPTMEIVIGCVTYLDLNFCLEVNLNRIEMNNGSSRAAYIQTKKIKDYIEIRGL